MFIRGHAAQKRHTWARATLALSGVRFIFTIAASVRTLGLNNAITLGVLFRVDIRLLVLGVQLVIGTRLLVLSVRLIVLSVRFRVLSIVVLAVVLVVVVTTSTSRVRCVAAVTVRLSGIISVVGLILATVAIARIGATIISRSVTVTHIRQVRCLTVVIIVRLTAIDSRSGTGRSTLAAGVQPLRVALLDRLNAVVETSVIRGWC